MSAIILDDIAIIKQNALIPNFANLLSLFFECSLVYTKVRKAFGINYIDGIKMTSIKNDDVGRPLGRGDTTAVFDQETLHALLRTKDTIGAVLRMHFTLEKLLDLWCNKITDCEDFFDLGTNVGFGLKLKISKKLGLPDDLVAVFQLFNKLRNAFAHKPNHVISDDELNNISHAVKRIHTTDLKEFKAVYQGDELLVSQNTSNLQDLILIQALFAMKAIEVFGKEFEKKEIPFSF